METIGSSYCDECGGTGFHLQGCATYENESEASQPDEEPETREPPGSHGKPSEKKPPELAPILRRAAVDFLTWAAYRIDPKTGSK